MNLLMLSNLCNKEKKGIFNAGLPAILFVHLFMSC
jgi:hypothetical protein